MKKKRAEINYGDEDDEENGDDDDEDEYEADKDEDDDDDGKDGRDGSERPCLAPPIGAAYCDENEGDDYEGGDNNGTMMM